MKVRKIMFALFVALMAVFGLSSVASAASHHHHRHHHPKPIHCKKGFHRNGRHCVKNPPGPQKGEKGDKGDTGAPGPAGPQGPAGPAGVPGVQGPAGQNGTNGVNGTDGTDGENGATGPQGPIGPEGKEGPQGPGAPTGLSSWGELVRNEFGSPTARVGNTSPASPDGNGALILATANGEEKAEYGSEIEFAHKKISELTAVSFEEFLTDGDLHEVSHVITTPGNQANIQMEVDPNGASGSAAGYSSLVFDPGIIDPSQVNQWSTVNAALAVAPNPQYGWYFSNGETATKTGCGQNAGEHFCTLAEVQAAAPDAEVSYSVGVGKGRDYQFQGFVDNLEIFGATYDFTANGVFKN